ncbi:M23 family metallopeptidase [bacterium]|nr:MAG: M23 family metallopeptidase [bacterium]
MDRKIFILFSIVVVFVLLIFYNLYSITTIDKTIVESSLPKINKIIGKQTALEVTQTASHPTGPFVSPIDRAGERVTKKTFGQFITPQNSPVQPEKFRGYHTGTDFEIFPEELNADVSVKAVCDGKIALKKTATGYGGVLVESCELDSQPVIVIYGHLKLASIKKSTGDTLAQGEEIGILGKAYSAETSGERKHLHLGIHKGAGVNILGYVQSKAGLSGWLDPVMNMSL